jgi:hypothetical protein
MNFKKPILLISIGVLNLLHGIFHFIQFVQSLLLYMYSSQHTHSHSWIDSFLHNPIWAFIWMVIGFLTLIIGIRDYKHHRKCKD